jgi:hypothetical protein
MPLLATLLGRQLGVTPTTQDQPETAVAFGLHHVPLGTATDLTVPAFAPVRPPVPPPRPQPWQQQTQPPQYAPPEPRRKPKPWFLALAVLLVAAVVATTVVLVSRDGTAQAAVDCTATAQRDRAGFTPCLRSLAGSVPDRSTCKEIDHLGQLLGARIAVICDFAGGSVSYYQGLTTKDFEVNAKLPSAGSAVGRGTWDGGGLHGQYVAGADKKSSIVLFGVAERRVAAIYLTEDPSRLEELIAGFTREIKPA